MGNLSRKYKGKIALFTAILIVIASVNWPISGNWVLASGQNNSMHTDASGGDTSGGDTSGGDTSGGDVSGGDVSTGDADTTKPDFDMVLTVGGEPVNKEKVLNIDDYAQDQGVKLVLVITDDVSGNGLSHVMYNFEDGKDNRIELNNNQEKITSATVEIPITKPEKSGSKEINITVYDVAGNEKSGTYSIESDVVAPTISCNSVEEIWHKEDVTLYPILADDVEGEITTYYEIYKKNNPSDNLVEDKTKDAVADSEGRASIEITADGYWTVNMWAKDKAGNESDKLEVDVKIDRRAPLSKAYVEYTEDPNSKPFEIEGNPSFIAKDKFELKLYLQDDFNDLHKMADYSDIASMVVEYNGKKQTVTPDSGSVALKEDKEFTDENVETAKLDNIYRIFELILDNNFGDVDLSVEEIVSQLKITSVTDNAGNTYQGEIDPTLIDDKENKIIFWIIDNVAPVLEKVEYSGTNGKQIDDTYYFTENGQVEISIKERYFNIGAKPKVEIETNGIWKEVSTLTWEEDKKSNTYTATVPVPQTEPTDNLETEYRVRVIYEDFVGNKLVSEKYIIEDDVYISNLMVKDQKAPILYDLSIKSADNNQASITLIDEYYYVKNQENEDINVTFNIEDAYFSEDNVTICVWKDGKLYEDAQIGTVTYQSEENNRVVGSFGFDSEVNPSGVYSFEIIYFDIMDNEMVLAEDATFSKEGITAGEKGESSYRTNHHLVLDGMAPSLESVEFNAPFQYASDLVTEENIKDSNTKLYYHEDIEVTFDITDGFFDKENVKVTLYKNELEFIEPVINDELGFTIRAEQDASTDGEYYFTLSYMNHSGMKFELGEKSCDAFYANSFADNIYTSPILVMDTKAPVIQITYTGAQEKANSLGEIDFYNTPYDAEITIEETNFRSKELTDWVDGIGEYGISFGAWTFKENGEKEYKDLEDIKEIANIKADKLSINAEGKHTLTIPIDQEGNYEIGVSYIDMAGNETILPVKQTVYDATRPEIEVTYEVKDSKFLDFIKYGDLGFLFAQQKIIVTAHATDQVSGIKSFHNKKNSEQVYSDTITDAIPISGKDFEGNYKMVVEDWSNNLIEHNRNYLVESQETHKNSSETSVTILTQPSRQVDGVNYYNATINDIFFTVNAREDFAGLSYVEIAPKAGSFVMKTDAMADAKANQEMANNIYKWNVKEYANSLQGISDAEIVKSFTHSGYFEVDDSNDKNGVGIDVLAMSNTGYSRTASSETFVIDKTPPTVSVTFNDTPVNDDNSYDKARIATITFTERNFSSEDIQWSITNTEGALPVISDFTNDNSTGNDNNLQHTGTITFSEDGNYTFSFIFMDKAGNEVEYTAEPFTVDVTAPVFEEVLYLTSGSSMIDDTYYYGDETAITLSLKELYFVRGVMPKVELETNGSWKELSDLEWKSSESAIYKTSIPLTKEGDNEETKYRIRVTYEDFVGNKMYAKDLENVVENGVFTSNMMVVDNKAPELHNLGIEPTDQNVSSIQLIDSLYYVKNQEMADLNVNFIIEDYYFSEDNVTINVLRDGVVQGDARIHNLTYKRDESNTNLMTGSFVFDSADNHIGTYSFEIIYSDYVGNKMVLAEDELFSKAGVTAGKMQNGSYKMVSQMVMDSEVPVLESMVFNAPYQFANNFITQNGIQNSNTQLYYNKDIQVTFSIVDGFFNYKDVEVKLYKKEAHYHAFDTSTFITPDVTYRNGELSFTIKATKDSSTDGEYYFTVFYKDNSGNKLELGTQKFSAFYNNAFAEHTYTSPIMVMDTKAPMVQVTYNGEIVNSLNEIDFYNTAYTAQITVDERNFRAKELTDWVNSGGKGEYGISLRAWVFNENGDREYKKLEDIGGTANVKAYQPHVSGKDRYSLTVPINQEGNHEVGVTYIDMAGNKAQVVPIKQTVYDKTRPKMEVSYQVEDSKFFDFIKYGDLGFFFAQKKAIITAQITDEVSGVKNFTHTVTGKNKQDEAPSTNTKSSETNKQSYTYTFTTTLPLSQNEQDFDGNIEMQVQDWSNNTEQQRQNHIVESQGTYNNSSSANIMINTAPSRQVDGVKYYNSTTGNIFFTVNASENYAGLRSVQIQPKSGSFHMGTDAMPSVEAKQEMSGAYQWNVTNSIVKNFTHTGSFRADEGNNRNGLQVEMSALSNAGYSKTAVSEPFSIDTTPPTAEVTFNDIPVYNESYYGVTRVATVTFRERNFSSGDIEWNITNTDGEMPVISGFTNDNSAENDNEMLHVGTVTFSEDGDYTFAFTFMDKAGNRMEYQAEPFTIDCTAPVIEVTYDNNNGANTNYFKDARTANIKITEHNFKESDVKATISATNNGVAIAAPNISSFRSEGDNHYATITCSNDSEITFDIAYTDNAGNAAVAMESQSFVVDLSDPEITIDQVVDSSANKGIVAPVIEVTDTNFDLNTVDVTLSGARCGVVDYENTQTTIPNGRRIAYGDFAYDVSVDDIYTLKVSIADKAGRISEQEIIFSVNRFGSTYQFSEATKKILDKYYINENENMVITETNVDTLEFKEIYLLVDGEKRNLSEGYDYTVEETGNQEKWKQYIYTLDKHNFEEEGSYKIIIYSEDKAENESDNRIKNTDIEFVIDKTAPILTVAGIEDDKQYVLEERLVTINVKDNVELDNMTVYLNSDVEKYENYTAEQIIDIGGVVSIHVGSSNSRQYLTVSAVDMAGNENQVRVEKFLISSDLFVQFYRNTPLFLGSIATVGLAIVGTSYAFLFRKRHDWKVG